MELRLALHQAKQDQAEEGSMHDGDVTKPMVKLQPKTQSKGKKFNVVSLLDQKSEPCLLKPKKLALNRQNVKFFAANSKTMSA